MFYIAKLARRLARLRLGSRLHYAGMFSLLLCAACSAGEPTSLDGGSLPDETKTLFISPRLITLEGLQGVRFSAYESLIPGSDEVTAIEWTATGGTLAADGTYSPPALPAVTAGAEGEYVPIGEPTVFKVIGKRKGWANKPPSDTATVIVVPPAPSLIGIEVTPSDKSVSAGTMVQFSAVGWLSDSSQAAVGVSWTATGGTIDAGGLYKAGSVPGSYKVVARHEATGSADTASITVTGATLQAVKINPQSTSLLTGTTKQFSTSGLMSDGTTVTLGGVTYSASGGSISSSGLYTAPSGAGSYTVTARVANIDATSLSSSASVSVSTPSSTGTNGLSASRFANLPTGYSRLAEHSLSWLPEGTNGNLGTWWYIGGSIVSDASAPWSPTSVYQVTLPAGTPGGAGRGGFGAWDYETRGEYRAVYGSFAFKIWGTEYENHPVRTKIVEIASGRYTGGAAENVIGISGEYGSRTLASSFKLDFAQQDVVSRNLSANVNTSRLLTVGTWHQIEVLMVINDIGSANGLFKMWIDGQQTYNYTDVVYRTAENPAKFRGWKHGIVWGGMGGEKVQNDRLLFDHVYLAAIQ